jgi:hypothetical protein
MDKGMKDPWNRHAFTSYAQRPKKCPFLKTMQSLANLFSEENLGYAKGIFLTWISYFVCFVRD